MRAGTVLHTLLLGGSSAALLIASAAQAQDAAASATATTPTAQDGAAPDADIVVTGRRITSTPEIQATARSIATRSATRVPSPRIVQLPMMSMPDNPRDAPASCRQRP